MNHLTHHLQKLRRDRNNNWPAATNNGAPHKPLLLLAMSILAEEGRLGTDGIRLNGEQLGELGDCFQVLWEAVLSDRQPVMLLPLWHLRSDKIWALYDENDNEVTTTGSIAGWKQFHQRAQQGRLHPELLTAFLDAGSREEIGSLLRETYFDAPTSIKLHQAIVDLRASRQYGHELLTYPHVRKQALHLNEAEPLPRPVRDAGFRRAVRTAYNHRCAICGIRVLTPGQRILVQGAHIDPWATSYDDRPVNGLALCPTCHWCFDEHLLRIQPKTQEIVCTKDLSEAENIPAHLQSLAGRQIFRPTNEIHAPDKGCLEKRWELGKKAK